MAWRYGPRSSQPQGSAGDTDVDADWEPTAEVGVAVGLAADVAVATAVGAVSVRGAVTTHPINNSPMRGTSKSLLFTVSSDLVKRRCWVRLMDR
jgi:hypothetical protein